MLIAALVGAAVIATSALAATGALTPAAAVKQAANPPASIGITVPLKKKPPTGKTIAFLECQQPVCQGFLAGLTPAAAVLGWHIKVFPFQVSAQSTLAAFTAAISAHVDGIFSTGLTRSAIASAIAAAAAKHIPMVTGYAVDAPSGNVIANIADGPRNANSPTVVADYIATQTGCKGGVQVFTIPIYQILTYTTVVFKAQLKKLCPSMYIGESDEQGTAVGTTLPRTP